MSDINCVVCGEPWDAYGVKHGDMLPWEAKLFIQGAGCPSCEGVANGYSPESISDVENGDDDPMDRILAAELVADGTAPKWTRPVDPTHWTCAACGIKVVTDLETNEVIYRAPIGTYLGRHDGDLADEKPEHTFSDGTTVCMYCLESCDKCGGKGCNRLSSNCYDEFALWPLSNGDSKVYCPENCHSEAEHEEANEVWARCYNTAERIDYIRDHRSQFEFHDMADMVACVRGNHFAGYASELVS